MRWLVRSAICALYPGSDRLPAVAELDLDRFLDKYMRESSLVMRLGLVLGAVVFTFSPLLTIGIPLPSFLLSKRALDRHARKAPAHPWYVFRQMVFILKLVGGMCWGEHPKVRKLNSLEPYPPDPGTWRTE